MDNSYDEKYYLNNRESLDEFYEKQSIIKVNRVIQTIYYKDTLKLYNELLDKTVELLKSLDIHDSINYSLALSFLINEGYLSHDLSFKAEEGKDKIPCRYGTSIVEGYGCCRNFSDLHRDVMLKLGSFVKSFYCYLGTGPILPKEKEANHVINLIDYDDALYGIDLHNGDRLFTFNTPFIMKDISFDSPYKLRYKPYYEILMGESNIEDIKEEIKKFEFESTKNHIGPYEYVDDIKVKSLEFLKRQRDMFMDFHNETSDLKKQIVLGLKNN